MYTKWKRLDDVTILVLSLKRTPKAPDVNLYPRPYLELKSTNFATS
jgi:hypothetical protein